MSQKTKDRSTLPNLLHLNLANTPEEEKKPESSHARFFDGKTCIHINFPVLKPKSFLKERLTFGTLPQHLVGKDQK